MSALASRRVNAGHDARPVTRSVNSSLAGRPRSPDRLELATLVVASERRRVLGQRTRGAIERAEAARDDEVCDDVSRRPALGAGHRGDRGGHAVEQGAERRRGCPDRLERAPTQGLSHRASADSSQ